ncbi:MAG: DUF1127 domain-containing protein [Pseudomonadota bacterium]
MGTIDTIRFQDQSIRIGANTFKGMESVPYRVWFQVMVAMVVAKLEKRRTRVHLSKLDAHALRDIGLTEAQADLEIRRSLPLYERNR